MRPVLFVLSSVDFGRALVIDLFVFLLLLGWRRVARALGENVPPLTPLGALESMCLATAVTAALWWVSNRFGPIEVKSYGAMLVAGFVAATAWCMKEGGRQGYKPVIFLDLAVYVLIGGIIGARAVYVALDWADYEKTPESILALWEGGLSFHGGVLGALFAGWIFALRRRLQFWKLADLTAPALALGYAFGRIGCFLNGCCYGGPTHLPWGVRFPGATWADGTRIDQPLHPTQLYASAAGLVIFVLLLRLRRFARRPGDVFAMFVMLYSVYRFLIEFLRRGVTGRPLSWLPALTEAQLASALLFIFSVAVILARGATKEQAEGGSGRKTQTAHPRAFN